MWSGIWTSWLMVLGALACDSIITISITWVNISYTICTPLQPIRSL